MLNLPYKISGFSDEIDGDIFKQIEVLKELGISYIELRSVDGVNISDFTLSKAKEIKAILDEHSIKVSAIGSPMGKISITDDFESHLDKLRHTIKIGKIFDTKLIRVFSFFIPEGEKPSLYKNEVFSRIKQMIEIAKKEDMILLHENEKDIYGDSVERCKELMDKFFCPNFKFTFDFANFVQCDQDTMVAYELLKKYIFYIHIKDAKKSNHKVVPAGVGDGNVKEILKDVFKNNYNGFLSLEPHLFEFDSLKNLEKNSYVREYEDPVVAYKVAFDALNEILFNI